MLPEPIEDVNLVDIENQRTPPPSIFRGSPMSALGVFVRRELHLYNRLIYTVRSGILLLQR